MPIASVEFCILCETVRPEPNGKANILGFYGVLPTATIVRHDFDKPIPAIMFLVGLTGSTEKESLLGIRIIAPDNYMVADLNVQEGIAIPAMDGRSRALAGIGFEGLVLNQEGTYTVEFVVNNTKALRSSFIVQRAASTSSTEK